MLCAPVKQLIETDAVELQEIDRGTHKEIYQNGKLIFVDDDWQTAGKRSIVSYHNYQETPPLEEILQKLQIRHPHSAFYKIATQARSTVDSLRMLEFLQRHPKVIGLCMGELGILTRICAPIFGVPWMYAPLKSEESTAPGQLTVQELKEIYHFDQLNRQTKIFGLIGNPLHQSPGHLYHNRALQGKNGVYVKMPLQASELEPFFTLAKKLPFRGLSVTAPLKEAVIPYLDELDPLAEAIGAVNTVVFKERRVKGYNTDGGAALDAIGDVKGKKMVILGAGGAARAIAFVALQRGADVVIVNRTVTKAQALAEQLQCRFCETVPPYDILVNATSVAIPFEEKVFIDGKVVMEVGLTVTNFQKAAQEAGCQIVEGIEMYTRQAAEQQNLWASVFSEENGY